MSAPRSSTPRPPGRPHHARRIPGTNRAEGAHPPHSKASLMSDLRPYRPLSAGGTCRYAVGGASCELALQEMVPLHRTFGILLALSERGSFLVRQADANSEDADSAPAGHLAATSSSSTD
jgi:hypothetical protein